MGRNPQVRLTYEPGGRMAVQFADPSRAPFAVTDPGAAGELASRNGTPIDRLQDAGGWNSHCSTKLSSQTRIPIPSIKACFSHPTPGVLENAFWPVMEDTGWLPIAAEQRSPTQLAEICLTAAYPGPFELIFYCYYAFPTDYPEDIVRIFGRKYFDQVIAPEAAEELRRVIRETSVEAAVTFNKGIFNLVSTAQVERYEDRLAQGGLVQSEVAGTDKPVPVFLTFPTGWRYHAQYRLLRKSSLEAIRTAISSGPGAARNVPSID